MDIRSTVGPASDANNWRKYLVKADDALAALFESPVCESCGECPQEVSTEFVGLCAACAKAGDV